MDRVPIGSHGQRVWSPRQQPPTVVHVHAQATVETVIKVSQNKRPEPEPEVAESPPPVLEQSPAAHSIIHHSWGHVGQHDAVRERG